MSIYTSFHSFVVVENAEPLHNFLALRLPHLSKRRVKELIERGFARVDGRQITLASYLLSKGQKISFEEGPVRKVPITVLHEDPKIIVLDKPPFVTSEEVQNAFGKGFLAHRLDKETSGCLLLAKDPITLAHLENLFRERKVQKEYIAIVFGEMEKEKGTIRHRLSKKGALGGQTLFGTTEEGGMKAETSFEVIKKRAGLSLVRLFPKTGRTHQIRVHLSEIGFPILGDKLYGSAIRQERGPDRLLLHARALEIPEFGLAVQSEMPSDFGVWFPI